MMIVKEQKKITFINNCNAIFDEEELSKAIMWYSTKPVISKKHIYMYALQDKKDITKSYYYDALGKLRYIDFKKIKRGIASKVSKTITFYVKYLYQACYCNRRGYTFY